MPEMYYNLLDANVLTYYYTTPWFVTLFTGVCEIFDKKDTNKFIIMTLENFFLDGWSAVFNSGFTLSKCSFNQIMKLNQEKLIVFMNKDLCQQDILDNDHFTEMKNHYIKNGEQINELFIDKLIHVTKFENSHEFIKNDNNNMI